MKLNNKFIITMPTWNAVNLIIDAITSVAVQNFDSIGVIIRDDLSTDSTYNKISGYLDITGIGDDTYVKKDGIDFIFVKNEKKLYPCGNIYESVVNYVENDDAIIGVVDGDDMLIGKSVLNEIYNVYQEHKAYVVYSNYVNSGGGSKGHCAKIEDVANYRNKGGWVSSHFRTAKAFLYKKINKKDLIFEGEYFKFAGDLALMYSLVEMAGNDRTIFYDKVCYLYNNNLVTNEHNVNLKEQQRIAGIIQSQKPYDVI